ncbi:MAG: hypothetical protein WDO16_01965 [Bacteroidota bacterium]
MTIEQLLVREKSSLLYSLPLNIDNIVSYFKLNITANGNTFPLTRPGIIAGQSFTGSDQQYRLAWNTEKAMLKSPVAFSIPSSPSAVYCTKITGQQTHFALLFQPSYPADYEVSPRLTVFWDISASSSKRNTSKEINFLKQFISYHNISALTILPFNYKILDTAVFHIVSSGNQWQQYLQNLEYTGSTQLGCIDLSAMKADMYMLFTDGNNTYGKAKPKTGAALVYAVHTSNSANLAALTDIVGSSGGKVIDLNKVTLSNAISINSKAENWLLDITSASGKTITEQSLPLKLNEQLLINGTMNSRDDTLLFHYGNNNRIAKVERVIINGNRQCTSAAIDRISMLNNFDRIIRSLFMGEYPGIRAQGKDSYTSYGLYRTRKNRRLY